LVASTRSLVEELRPSGDSLCASSNPASVCSPLGSVMPGASPHTRILGPSVEASIFVALSRATLLSVYEKKSGFKLCVF